MKQKIFVLLVVVAFTVQASKAVPVMTFTNKEAVNFSKTLSVGQVELLEFASPVSLAHYGTSRQSMEYIELEKLEPSVSGYKKFMLKAKAPGSGELTFKSGEDIIKVKIYVRENFSQLEDELNNLFGMKDSSVEDQIKVISASLVSDLDVNFQPHIYLKGTVTSAKNALLAVAFAANAVGDSGVKIYSNPGGQLRLKDLDLKTVEQPNNQNNNNNQASFVEFYESTNKLIDTNNLNRDLILSSTNERVVSFLKIKEPKRFAIKVRFLEMDSHLVDDFISSISATSKARDILGSGGSTDIGLPNINRSLGISTAKISDAIAGKGLSRLTDQIVSGGLVSGSVKLLDNVFLNLNINDLLQEGVLKVINEFSLVTHSGETVALGKGTRFPIPKLNNTLANSSISIEYIPIGFKGELKVTALASDLIDVQLASRLSSAEATTTTIGGLTIPIFSEEYVNSGALLADKQEVILNAFLSETEAMAKATSPLGRLVPFIGSSKHKQKNKSLLFIALQAQEITPSSIQANPAEFSLPQVELNKQKNIFAHHIKKLRQKNINSGSIDLASINRSELKSKPVGELDLLDLEGDL